uniref:Peptidase A1 domain-containing protein n=1 Tax=Physcomitrium patens TaxID=3218 RepID=A0A7I4BPB5_PHYPA
MQGPHGLFVPEDYSYLKCIGETASLCEAVQNGIEPCNSDNKYLCVFIAHYADNSYYSGVFVHGNFTVPLQDKSEANVLGLLGCVVSKVLQGSEQVPLITDGLIGLGNCKGTLMEHWSKSNVISQNVLAVCLAKELERNTTISPATPRGFISLGNDFKEQFDRNSVWSKLADAESGVLCGYAAKLLSISFHDKALVFSSRFARQSIGISLLFDTGSDMTYFDAVFYDPLLRMLEDYATLRGYIRVEDNDKYVVNEQRVCWEPPRKTMTGGSPIQDFLPLVLAFEGIPSTTESAPLQYLVVHPENYLSWDAQVKKLCVNILQDYSVGTSVSNLGADMMREHLFVFDYEKQRVRWQSNSCAFDDLQLHSSFNQMQLQQPESSSMKNFIPYRRGNFHKPLISPSFWFNEM